MKFFSLMLKFDVKKNGYNNLGLKSVCSYARTDLINDTTISNIILSAIFGAFLSLNSFSNKIEC